MITQTVQTIKEQLLAQGMNPRLVLVAFDENTLRAARGCNGALVHYNPATDLYDVDEYHGFDITRLATGVQVAGLFDLIMPCFTARIRNGVKPCRICESTIIIGKSTCGMCGATGKQRTA